MLFRSLLTWRIVTLVLLAAAGAATHARAASTPDPLRSVPLAGGYRPLEPLTIRTDVPRAQVLPLLIRLMYQTPEGGSREWDARREEFVRTLAALNRVRALIAAHPDGIALQDARDQRTRAAVRDVLDSLGVALVEQRGQLTAREATGDAELARTTLSRGGVNVADMVTRLNAGERLTIVIPVETMPFPLAPSVWATLLERRTVDAEELLPLVLASRQASLFAYGLLAMDAPSRGWLAGTPRALKAAWNNPAVFANAARSLTIRNGSLALPGTDAARTGWETLVGARLTDTEKFVSQLLSRDDGRLAFFFDTLVQLDAPHAGFALAANASSKPAVRDLYDIAAGFDPSWKLLERPFARKQLDLPLVLRAMRIDSSGKLTGPAWRRFWDAVVSGEAPSAKTMTAKWLQADGAIDALWIAKHLAPQPSNVRNEQLQRLLFAQRVFASATAADAADMAVVLVHHAKYRSVLTALERIGVTSPATYAAGVRAAAAIDRMDRDRRAGALTQFQGSLALLGRLRTVSAINPPAADSAARALFELGVDEDHGYQGRVTAWLARDPWPANAAETAADITEQMLASLAGARASSHGVFTWESERYTTSTVTYETGRLRTGLRGGSSATLGEAIELWRALDRIAHASTPALLRTATTDATSLVERARVQPEGLAADEAREVVDDARKAIRELLEIRNPGNLDRVAGRMRPLLLLVDRMTADALRTMTYLAYNAGADLSSVPDLAARHQFGFGQPGQTDEQQQAAPWRLAQTRAGGRGSVVEGSLLALDVAFVRSGLRRLQSATPRPASVPDALINVLGHGVLLADATRLTDDTRDAIATALRRGRERVATAVSTPASGSSPIAALTAAVPGMSSWRANALEWVVANAPGDVLQQFTLDELLVLGTPGPLSSFDPWGASQQLHTGCPCVEFSPPLAFETSGGHPGSAEPGAHFNDISLRLAEEMSLQHVPAGLFPSLLAYAISDVVDDAQAADDDDLMALSRSTRVLTRDRVSDYVAAVVGRGIVAAAPASKGAAP